MIEDVMEIRVLTGKRFTDKGIGDAVRAEAGALAASGWERLWVDAEMHPSEVTAAVEALVRSCAASGYGKVFFVSNCDHVFNILRVLRKEGSLSSVSFSHFSRDAGGSVVRTDIAVGDDGECSSYPLGFLDEWPATLGRLA